MTFTRITVDADRMGGVPCVRDLRFPVASVVSMIADRMTAEEILTEHPDLETEDVAECLRYAALAVQRNPSDVSGGHSAGRVIAASLWCQP